ncbi:DJ-1/PfpI family protein [uncultured Zhongshania sp.]|uniref:DJ-1/PfpI family protein n=1 Tax=uncultured Zhongshania sp. TaxID=1642288 RepID=UPI0025E9B7B1|nr:DJ-1/PfpI family protein [uncultured Zhongshania sp.]
MNVGIYCYENAEVLDFAGPFEVFSTASRLCGESPPFEVFLISEKPGPVLARAGFSVSPNYHFANHPTIDLLIVVGGVHDLEMDKPAVLAWIKTQARQASLVASVCTGVFLLAAADVVTDHKVTTHWEDVVSLRERFPNLHVCEETRWVDSGNIISSGGISAGIDMSLYIVGRLQGSELAVRTAKQMEFDWIWPEV